ncbi:CPBP family intramembrane glutamic endopeptidase [Granulicella sp. S190]|uniref:CPBP family intramembrane glutamic endopeptidase n=1 Tax=Granulicella sp. S190 TaxID=1747226 RepID=UPI0020B141F3|nr:CPBP family intramembrane glutamic endopeptidase [Granulicella sp. S190]
MSSSIASALDFAGAVGHSPAGWRRRAMLDLIVGYALILIVIWTPVPLRTFLYFVTLGWIAYSTWTSFSSWDAMGVRLGGFFRSIWVVGVTLCLVAAAVIFAAREHTLHAPHSVSRLVHGFWGYAVWSFFQQFLLNDFVLQRLLRLTKDRRVAVMGSAGLFALAHLPNPVLTAMTLVWGVVGCLIFLRYRNLFTLGMSHAILGICVAVTLPASVQHNMRVGLGYLRYQPHVLRHLNQISHRVSTVALVVADAPTQTVLPRALP